MKHMFNKAYQSVFPPYDIPDIQALTLTIPNISIRGNNHGSLCLRVAL